MRLEQLTKKRPGEPIRAAIDLVGNAATPAQLGFDLPDPRAASS